MLVGCTVSIYQNVSKPDGSESSKGIDVGKVINSECTPIQPPNRTIELSLPVIDPEHRNDDSYIANKLLDYIQRLVAHIKLMEEYAAECHP